MWKNGVTHVKCYNILFREGTKNLLKTYYGSALHRTHAKTDVIFYK